MQLQGHRCGVVGNSSARATTPREGEATTSCNGTAAIRGDNILHLVGQRHVHFAVLRALAIKGRGTIPLNVVPSDRRTTIVLRRLKQQPEASVGVSHERDTARGAGHNADRRRGYGLDCRRRAVALRVGSGNTHLVRLVALERQVALQVCPLRDAIAVLTTTLHPLEHQPRLLGPGRRDAIVAARRQPPKLNRVHEASYAQTIWCPCWVCVTETLLASDIFSSAWATSFAEAFHGRSAV